MWAIVKLRAVVLGFRVLSKTWKFDPDNLAAFLPVPSVTFPVTTDAKRNQVVHQTRLLLT